MNDTELEAARALLGEAENTALRLKQAGRGMTELLGLQLQACGEAINAAQTAARAAIVAALAAENQTVSMRPEGPLEVAGRLVVDPATRAVILDGAVITGITGKEFKLLVMLAREPTRVFTKGELLHDIWEWDDTDVSGSRALDSHACRLRQRLGGPPWVENIWGVGYRAIDPFSSEGKPLALVSNTAA